ncbi:MAG: hypothetical protein JNL54_19970, partial [Kineosporiaceae bacterium]|nr:hypothetical protein [Kineosporiaceae bacterium]
MTSERRAHRDRSNRRSRAASPTTRVWRALAVAMPVTVILLAVAAVQTGAISRFGDWLLGPTTTAARLTTTNQSDGGPVTYPPAAIRGGALPERTGTAARGTGEAQDGDRGGAAQARRTTTATSAAKSARTAKTRSGTTTTSTPAQQSTTTSTTGSAGETTTSTAAPTTSTSTTTAPQTTTTASTPATATQAPSSDQATEVIRLTNAARAANGCSVALKADGKLTNAAQGHSADMAAKNY